MNACVIPATPLRPAYLTVALGDREGFEAHPQWRLVGCTRSILKTQAGNNFEQVDLVYVLRPDASSL